MKAKLSFAVAGAAAIFLAGCATPIPPGAELGSDGTMAYDVLVEATSPGVRIDANGEFVGETPLHLKIFGDPDGKFHNFGSKVFEIRAFPVATNQFSQAVFFRTGGWFNSKDRIPKRIYFDMTQPAPKYVPVYIYQPPLFYGPPFGFYGSGPYFYGPSFPYYYNGPGYYRGHRGRYR